MNKRNERNEWTKMVHAQCSIMIVDHDKVDMSRVPIIVILGATGSGKSRLAIELARKFSGEIISADSMQVYKGLDIVTAKVTKEEKNLVPHHMLDIVDPLVNFSVLNFRDMALSIVDNLLTKSKIPIIVGGTNYYIESLLWKILIPDVKATTDQNTKNTIDSLINETTLDKNIQKTSCESEDDSHADFSPKKMKIEEDETSDESNEELFKRLQLVDPEMAKKLHPNNRRKIMRSLEVFEQYGVTHSELLKAQRTAGGSGLGGPLRLPNSIILWLCCDTKVLEERLDRRVDAMVKTGLVKELLDFHRRYNEQRIKFNTSPDYTKGIFQSIGFKEFHNYLLLSEEERQSEKGQAILKQGIEDLKLVTKRYAKKQNRWVRNRLVRRIDRQVPPLYSLDCTDVELWDKNVLEPAEAIIYAALRGEKPEQRPLIENPKIVNVTDSSDDCHYCEVCERTLIGDVQWNAHINGMKHMRIVKKKQKLAAKEEAAKRATKSE